jgi:hypothetical protein
MSKKPRDFPGQAFLELLRPPKLAQTRLALFASYSADPIVLGGALLHLHARGRDNGGGNKSDFASAVEALRDRVRFVVQRGRIHRGRKLPKIAAVFDQFVIEMPYRERENSWHPKLAIICYEGADGRRTWRLWIGSRNLTLSRDLDLGLMLDGEPRRRKGGRAISGIDGLAAELARHAALPGVDPNEVAQELRSVRWIAPDGMDIAEVQLWPPGTRPAFPFSVGEKRKLVVLSPFLCDEFVAALAQTTAQSSDRTLVTTLPAVRKLSPVGKANLAGFKLLSLSAPAPEGDASQDEASTPHRESIDGEEAETPQGVDHSGLHAKLYAAIRGEKVDVVTGSANATHRAWSGRNAEAVARFSGGKSEVDGIAAIVGSAFPISGSVLESLTETEGDIAEQRLERIRWQLAELPLLLRRDGKRFTLACDPAPAIPADASLEVGLATMLLLPWPQRAKLVEMGDVPLSLQTDFVQFRLSLGELPPACWLQRVAVSPSIDADRDSAAISRFLSIAGLQAWLREMLEGDSNAGAEDDWDAEEGADGAARRESWKHDGFALEDILSAWARNDQDKLRRVDSMLDRYVAAVLAHSEHLPERDRKDLAALQDTWRVARDVLLAPR